MNLRDIAERVVWTFIAAALTNLGGAAILDLEVWKAAALAGVNAVITYVTLLARQHLTVIPDPGDGLPGFEVDP